MINMKSELVSSSHAVGEAVYHFEWCTKYRYKMFGRADIKRLAERAIRTAAERHGIETVELCVAAEHVHLEARLPHTMSVARAMNLLKGASSHAIFRARPNFRKRYPRGRLWSPGKFYRTVGQVDEQTVRRYIRAHSQQTLEAFA
jgi:putative transposase